MTTPDYTKDWPREGLQDDGSYVVWKYFPNSHRPKAYLHLANQAEYYLRRQGGNKERLITRAYINAKQDPSGLGLNYLIGEFKLEPWGQLHWLFDQYLPPGYRWTVSTDCQCKVPRTKDELCAMPFCTDLSYSHKGPVSCKLDPAWFPDGIETNFTEKNWTSLKKVLATSIIPHAQPPQGWLERFLHQLHS